MLSPEGSGLDVVVVGNGDSVCCDPSRWQTAAGGLRSVISEGLKYIDGTVADPTLENSHGRAKVDAAFIIAGLLPDSFDSDPTQDFGHLVSTGNGTKTL